MMLRDGERVTDEARFLASHTRYIASLKGKAREAYQENLKRFNEAKHAPPETDCSHTTTSRTHTPDLGLTF